MNDINSQSMLRIGTILRGIYKIESYLSSGGFGNTYIAKNIEFDEQYAIKEFFWKGVAERDENQTTVSISNSENVDNFNTQREKFKKEARRLRLLNNSHIVKVYDLFEENGTAYYVMDYVDGENLSTRLKRTNEPLTETEVRNILPQVLDALKAVHAAGIWHLDLKPANIMVDKSGNVKLIDFGASKQLNAQKGGATTSTAISYTNGYAPREQMEQNYDKFGPWTDIYALGATLYALLTNKRPPLPTDIDDDISDDKHVALPFPATVSEEMKSLVLKMMKTNRMQRPQSVEDIRIEEAKTPEPVETHEPAETPEADNTQEETQILNKETETGKKNEETIIAEAPKNGWGRETGKNYTTGLELDWVYEGEFKNGKRNGRGTMTWSNGEKHEGGFQDGYFHGAGVHTYSNGEIVRGVWAYGGLKEKTSTTKEEKKGRKKAIDFLNLPFNRFWIHAVTLTYIVCLVIEMVFNAHYYWEAPIPIKNICETLLWLGFAIGIKKIDKKIFYISIPLIILSTIATIINGIAYIFSSINIVWIFFEGIYILRRYEGKIRMTGVMFTTYLLCSIFGVVWAGFFEGFLEVFDLVVYLCCFLARVSPMFGIWWILTRKEESSLD